MLCGWAIWVRLEIVLRYQARIWLNSNYWGAPSENNTEMRLWCKFRQWTNGMERKWSRHNDEIWRGDEDFVRIDSF